MISFLNNAISEIFLTLKEKAARYAVAFVQRTIPAFIMNSLFPVPHPTSGSSTRGTCARKCGALGSFSMSFLFVHFVSKKGPKLNHGRASSLKGPGWHKAEKRSPADFSP